MHCNRLAGIDRGFEARVIGVLQRLRDGLAKAPVCAAAGG
jgi:hypothetical protein